MKNRTVQEVIDAWTVIRRGDVVNHICGSRGLVRTLQNNWESVDQFGFELTSDPPRVIAIVQTLDTTFPVIREIPVTDLRFEYRIDENGDY